MTNGWIGKRSTVNATQTKERTVRGRREEGGKGDKSKLLVHASRTPETVSVSAPDTKPDTKA